MINPEIHKEIHAQLLRRKSPNQLWGSPFDNAWVGFVLYDHKDMDETTINEILEFFDKWIHSATISEILKEERNIGAMCLYSGIAFNLKRKENMEQLQTAIMERITELDKKEKWKFGFFNSHVIFYFTVVGLAMSGMLRESEKEILLKYARNEVKNHWYKKINRFAFYSAALFELGAEDAVFDEIVNFLSSINLRELNVDEIVPLLWFMIKYSENIFKSIKDATLRNLIEEKKETLWKQFENQSNYFSYEPRTSEDIEIETGTMYSLSTFELGLIDDFFACQEKVSKEVDPNTVFNLLELHWVIKNASEKLFKDKHYAQAIFEAYKALINYVKKKSGKTDLDGEELMGTVFGIKYDKETFNISKKPILQLNELLTREDLDEQKGFMFLFMGSVTGIRNPKAHGIIEEKDPFKTLEYLSLASLLAKRVDEAKLNTEA